MTHFVAMRKVAKFNRPAKGHGNKENRRKRESEWISFSNCSQRSDRDLEYYLIDCTYLLATELHNKLMVSESIAYLKPKSAANGNAAAFDYR